MSDLMGRSLHTDDLFDFPVVKFLLRMVLPLELDETGLWMKSGDGCKNLWPAFERVLTPRITSLSQEMVDNHATFPLLIYSFKHMTIEKEKAKVDLEKYQAEARESVQELTKTVTAAKVTLKKSQVEALELRKAATSIICTMIDEYPKMIYNLVA